MRCHVLVVLALLAGIDVGWGQCRLIPLPDSLYDTQLRIYNISPLNGSVPRAFFYGEDFSFLSRSIGLSLRPFEAIKTSALIIIGRGSGFMTIQASDDIRIFYAVHTASRETFVEAPNSPCTPIDTAGTTTTTIGTSITTTSTRATTTTTIVSPPGVYVPLITSLNPDRVTYGRVDPLEILVIGSRFAGSSGVLFDLQPVNVDDAAVGQGNNEWLRVVVPATLFEIGDHYIQVVNPNGARSNRFLFRVTSQ
jgi:hypothetical protein